jgi:hypothetical protein
VKTISPKSQDAIPMPLSRFVAAVERSSWNAHFSGEDSKRLGLESGEHVPFARKSDNFRAGLVF